MRSVAAEAGKAAFHSGPAYGSALHCAARHHTASRCTATQGTATRCAQPRSAALRRRRCAPPGTPPPAPPLLRIAQQGTKLLSSCSTSSPFKRQQVVRAAQLAQVRWQQQRRLWWRPACSCRCCYHPTRHWQLITGSHGCQALGGAPRAAAMTVPQIKQLHGCCLQQDKVQSSIVSTRHPASLQGSLTSRFHT